MALSTFGFAVVDARILQQYGEEQANGTFVGDVIIIAATLLLSVVAVFGCVGAFRDNAKILYLVSHENYVRMTYVEDTTSRHPLVRLVL